ncbi:MAG TPA: DUF2939 domain-containing protein [Alphaproteobacteria bacterium]
MSKLFSFALLVVLVVGAYAWITPYRTVQKLVEAMEHEDPVSVDQYVDFDSVRANFQDDFATRMGLDNKDEESLASALVSRIAGAFISGIVSPETMVTVLKDNDRRERLGLSDDLGVLIQRGDWINKDQFILHDDYNNPTMLLQRKGLAWEVTAISLK